MAKRCIFCGGKPTTVEHVLSRQLIATLMPKSQNFTTHWMRLDDDGETERRVFESRAGKGDAGSHPVKCVCGPCNNGWMQELDERLKPALPGLAAPERGTISRDGCRLFATWATKIALLIDEIWPPGLDPEIKRWFGREQIPPATWTYWVALIDETMEASQLRAVTLTRGPSESHVEGIGFTFRVLHLLVQVIVPVEPVLIGHGASGSPYVHRIWPRMQPFKWPPPRASWLPNDGLVETIEKSLQATRVRPHRTPPAA